jgi:hypothetical protein
MSKKHAKANPVPQQLKGVQATQNNLPNWLNIVFVSVIFVTCIYGGIRFMDPAFKYEPGLGIHNYRLFFPAGIAAVLYSGLLFVTTLFSEYDLATVMFVLLLVVGFAVLAAGVFTKDEANKVKFFELASAVLGLGFGIPFGERLRSGHKT